MFSADQNRDLLTDLLNAVFVDAPQPRVSEVTVLNPALDAGVEADKEAVLDIKARTETGLRVDVEMQLANHQDMVPCTLYYWAKLFDQQLTSGERHQPLHKAVTINVVNFRCLAAPAAHSMFHLRDVRTGERLTELCEVHFVELPKALEGASPALLRWLSFWTQADAAHLEVLAVGDPMMAKAVDVLTRLSQDREVRERYEAREKWRHDYVSDVEGARDEGRQEGRQEMAVRVAKNLLAMGRPADEVMAATGLSRAEVEALKS